MTIRWKLIMAALLCVVLAAREASVASYAARRSLEEGTVAT